jgi:hypothetical protein
VRNVPVSKANDAHVIAPDPAVIDTHSVY